MKKIESTAVNTSCDLAQLNISTNIEYFQSKI